MRRNLLRKTAYRDIARSPGRFLAILCIILLGCAVFVGLRTSDGAMKKTADSFLRRQKFYDFSVVSTLGITAEDIDEFSKIDGVAAAEGAMSVDAIFSFGGKDEVVLKTMSVTENINIPALQEGRMPEAADECVIDSEFVNVNIGDKIILSSSNDEDTEEIFALREFTVVGKVISPLYMNFERGNTSLGSGVLSGFVYLTYEAYDVDYYTTAYIRYDNMPAAYSDEYAVKADGYEPILSDIAEERGVIRYHHIRAEAESELADGIAEYEDGLAEYKKEKAEAEAELEDARIELENAREELDDGWNELRRNERNASKELDDAEAELENARLTLEEGEAQYSAALAEFDPIYAPYAENLAAYQQVAAAYEQINYAYDIPGLPSRLELNYMKAELDAAGAQLEPVKAELDSTRAQLDAGWDAYNEGMAQIEEGRKELRSSIARARRKLENAEVEYEDGMREYLDGKAEAEAEFAEAEAELADAKAELDEARIDVDSIERATIYVLGREANVGYACFGNDSSIVKAISRVFPVFFFLVAALICVTTITRMVDEQRTQIGIYMAMGYSPMSIMSKFLIYSGLASVLGGVIGIVAGSYIFPAIIWKVYGIMYTFSPDIEFYFNWTLSLITFFAYIAAMLFVTWTSCRKELSSMPSAVLRHKSPTPGRSALVEKIPFLWNRLSFMWKVSLRNIFRYKRRVFMMILGVAGCAALLVTGFGIRDSIQNIVEYQYDEITLYDFDVMFSEALTDRAKEEFVEESGTGEEDILFLSQSAVDALFNGNERSVYLSVPTDTEHIGKFMDFHNGETPLAYPKDGEALVSRGLADDLGFEVGDTIMLRSDEMGAMKLTVCGIYDNYINHNVFITYHTYKSVWGTPDIKSAYVLLPENADGDAFSANLLSAENVMNVSSSASYRERMSTMMSSLIYIVILVIVCAGALAFIVIYNLTNISITERLREIATVKVLGFYPSEAANYVLRENVLLSFVGAAVGMPLGVLLTNFIIGQIKVDMVTFVTRIAPVSFLISFALTIFFSLAVDAYMVGKLNKIDMAAALKAAE